MRTEPKARILEAFSRFAETSRRGTGSAIGAPEQTSPPDHPFRPAGAPELLCGGAVVITEQTAQSLTTSHLPVRTADAFFRFEQRVPEPLMVALSVIMMDELSDGTAQRLLTEEDHPLQALALDRQNKPGLRGFVWVSPDGKTVELIVWKRYRVLHQVLKSGPFLG